VLKAEMQKMKGGLKMGPVFPDLSSPYFGSRIFSFAIVFAIAMLFIVSGLLMWLWNITIPKIFNGVREITFWEAFRLLLIAGILFGNGLGLNF
jgi:hypothetical protein